MKTSLVLAGKLEIRRANEGRVENSYHRYKSKWKRKENRREK